MADWLDERRLVLSGNEEGHPDRLYVQDVEEGAIRALPGDGFILSRNAATTPDGKAVLVRVRPPGRWSLLPVDGGKPRPVPAMSGWDEPLQWSVDGRALFVAHRAPTTPETGADVYRVDIASGRRELFKRLSPPDPAGVEWIERIALTPDGKGYCYTYRQTLGTLYVAEGLK